MTGIGSYISKRKKRTVALKVFTCKWLDGDGPTNSQHLILQLTKAVFKTLTRFRLNLH